MISDTPESLDPIWALPSGDIGVPNQIEGKEEVLVKMRKIGTEIDKGLVAKTNQLIERVRDLDPINYKVSKVNLYGADT